MNVLFVYSASWNYRVPSKPMPLMMDIQLGISYISSVLKSKGHSTSLIVLTDQTKKKVLDERIQKFKPKIVLFTSVFTEYDIISRAAEYMKKKYPSLTLVIGGPHASMNPEDVINGPFDIVCIGEGEYPALELASQMEINGKPSKIRNLWIKKDANIEKNPTREFLHDLDGLPFPDREMWVEWTEKGADRKQMVLIGRGCPFNCTYCSNHILKKLASGRYVRFRSSDNIIAEVREITRKYPRVDEIFFEVETLGADMKLGLELCSKLQKMNKEIDNKIKYKVNLRITPGADYDPLFSEMKKANFSGVFIGLESGSKRIRERVLKRNYSNEDIKHTVALAKRYGLDVDMYVLIGLPWETLSDFNETINCLRECQPNNIMPSIFFPYPGTEIHSMCKKEGLMSDAAEKALERRVATLNLPYFPKARVQHEYEWIDYKVYKGKRPFLPLIAEVLRRKIQSNYILFRLLRKIRYYISGVFDS